MKTQRFFMLIRALAYSVALAAAGRALCDDGDFGDLLQRVPASANTLVVLNPEKIFASEVATQEGWKQKYEATYANSPLLLPPSARQFVLAADLDLTTFDPRWQAAVMRLDSDPSTAMIARTVRGRQDKVAGLDAVSTPRGSMIVKFGPSMFGLRQPGDRQTVGRWVQEAAKRREPALSPYLKEAAEVPDRVGTEIIMAIDLSNALSESRVRAALSQSKVLADAKIDPDAVSTLISNMHGMTLGARVTKRVYGKLKIDFDRDASVLAKVAKPLLLEILDEAGASIDEFADWNVKVEQRRITLDGELTQSGLRRLFSFLELDATAVDADKDSKEANGDATEPKIDAYASLQYFQAINSHLNDLKHERGASSYYSIAGWFDKYARRIDRMPILHVDKDLVDYGHRTVGQLRNCVDAIRGAGIRSSAQSAQVTSGYVGYDPYVFFSSSSNYAKAEVNAVEQERRAIRAQEKGASSAEVRAIIRQIQDDTSNIRRQMTERYNMEFDTMPKRTTSK